MSDEQIEQAETCPRCGADLEWVACFQFCEDGWYDEYEYDAVNNARGTWVPCETCDGKGGWLECLDCPVAMREHAQPVAAHEPEDDDGDPETTARMWDGH